MADNEIRNPAKAYFKWKLPVIAKSEDDWNFWNTEDKYNRTLFIGYNDTTTPHVASLFLIEDGKAIQAVGDDVLARIAQTEVNVAQALADIQELIARANAQQAEISNLQQECERILAQAADAVEDAQTWAEGSDEDVADLGGEHSAKGWAQKANDIIASGLPSDATFDHITVTGNSKFGQDPDRENQPGLEIEGTGEIQAYRTVNMLNGATVSYDETVEMPWSDSSNKVPNTAWVQQAVQHGTIDSDSEITCKKITTTTGGLDATLIDDNITNTIKMVKGAIGKPIELKSTNQRPGSSSWLESSLRLTNESVSITASNGLEITANVLGLGNEIPVIIKLPSTSSLQDKRSFYVGMRADLIYGACIGGQNVTNPAFWVYRDAENAYAWIARFFVTPTVPDIMDTSDSSSKVPNTKWVQAAVAANVSSSIAGYQPKLTAGSGITISEDNVISATGGGGSGGDAVDSVNGKTGEVILSGQDIKTDPNASNTLYQDYTALSTQLTGKQDEIGQDTSLSLNTLTLADSSTGTVGKLTMASQDGTVEFAPSGTLVGSIIGRNGEGLLINASDIHIGYQFSSPTAIRLSRTDLKATHNFATDFTGAVSCSANIAADDDSIQLATTQWVNAAIAAAGGGSGGGAVSSVNGKTGEVVLSASDVGAASTSDLASYVTTNAMNTELTNYATTSAVDTKLTEYQPKLIAGEGISISDSNVISATGGGSSGGAVESINGKTGAVVLTGEDIAINTATGANTINDVVANLTSMVINKQDAITATSDLVVNSVQAAGTSSSAYLSPHALRFSTATVDMLYANSRGVYLSNLTGGYNASDTGQFDWYMNNTTDYNKFNIYSRYYTDDAEDPDIKIPNDNLIMSAGGAPGGASTWVDFTANYLSFKGAANFGEGGDDTHTMNFNGPSFFNNNVSFVKQETSGTSTALTFNKDTGGFTFITDASFQGTLIASGESTMHKLTVGDGVEGQAFILETEAELNASVKLGWNSGRLYCMRDEYNWLFDFNRSANVGERIKFNDDVRILSSMPEAADDSTIVPNTAWVQDAIDAKNARIEISSSATVTQSVKIEPLSNGTLYTVTYNGVVTSGTPIVLLAPSGGSYVGCVRLANTIAANKPNTSVQVGCADEINGSGELTVTPTLGIAEAQVTIVVTLYKAAS